MGVVCCATSNSNSRGIGDEETEELIVDDGGGELASLGFQTSLALLPALNDSSHVAGQTFLQRSFLVDDDQPSDFPADYLLLRRITLIFDKNCIGYFICVQGTSGRRQQRANAQGYNESTVRYRHSGSGVNINSIPMLSQESGPY
jgi:hypothetical protein